MGRFIRVSKLGSKPNRAGYLPWSQATVWRAIKNVPDFPKPFSLTPGIKVVDADELDAWVESKRETMSQGAPGPKKGERQ